MLVCSNCHHRVVKDMIGESVLTLHYGSVKRCQYFQCGCEKPQ